MLNEENPETKINTEATSDRSATSCYAYIVQWASTVGEWDNIDSDEGIAQPEESKKTLEKSIAWVKKIMEECKGYLHEGTLFRIQKVEVIKEPLYVIKFRYNDYFNSHTRSMICPNKPEHEACEGCDECKGPSGYFLHNSVIGGTPQSTTSTEIHHE